MLTKGVVWGLATSNAYDHLIPPKHSQQDRSRLSEDDIRRFTKSVRDDRLEALFVILVTTGLRISEVLGLTESDLNLDEGTVRIRQQIQRTPNEGYKLVGLKTKGSHRIVDIGQTTVRSLVEHRSRIAEERLRLGAAWDGEMMLVFPNHIGRPLSLPNIRNRNFKPAAVRADLPTNTTIHDLRHAFAALALSKGQDIATVSSMLGHRNISTTLDRYAYAIPGRGRRVAELMDSLVV